MEEVEGKKSKPRRIRPVASNERGRFMYLAVGIFIIGFAMAVGAVFVYMRASENSYEQMRLDLHATKAEIGDAQKQMAALEETNDSWKDTLEKLEARVNSLEKRPTDVNVKIPKVFDPIPVYYTNGPKSAVGLKPGATVKKRPQVTQ